MPKRLQVADPGEAAEKPKKLTVTQAAAEGSHRDLLASLRDRVAAAVQSLNCPPVALAALSRQLASISRELSTSMHASRMRSVRPHRRPTRLGTVPSER